MDSIKDEHLEFWTNEEKPERYIEGEARSRLLAGVVYRYCQPPASILEPGCNVGRNLHYLHQIGYEDLAGIEVSERAVNMMRLVFPILPAQVSLGLVEDILPSVAPRDVVVTMAHLEHLPPESEWLFPVIAEKTGKLLVTLEDEKHTHSHRIWPRNYAEVFGGLGMTQVFEYHCKDVPGLNDRFYLRAFQWS